MDELPDLTTDADVDALMGRLRARLAGAAAAPGPVPRLEAVSAVSAAGPATALSEVLAAQDRLAAALGRAMASLADALDELHVSDDAPGVGAPPLRVVGRRRGATAARTRPAGGRGSRRK